VLLINVAGSLALGALLAEEWGHPRARLLLHDFGGIGFCGGLTTFSTFAVEVVDLLRDGATGQAALYLALSVGLAVAGVVAGAVALRSFRALMLPLEEEP
jgi:CrcB protein